MVMKNHCYTTYNDVEPRGDIAGRSPGQTTCCEFGGWGDLHCCRNDRADGGATAKVEGQAVEHLSFDGMLYITESVAL